MPDSATTRAGAGTALSRQEIGLPGPGGLRGRVRPSVWESQTIVGGNPTVTREGVVGRMIQGARRPISPPGLE
jgi:hypothetical protein